MTFQSESDRVRWKLHLRSAPARVFELLATDHGRSRFWAETLEHDGTVRFRFPNGDTWSGRVLERDPPRSFAVEYIGGSVARFQLAPDGTGGTDLELADRGVPAADREETIAGWVSVLLALKAAADFGVDLRNHDATRHWGTGYADN